MLTRCLVLAAFLLSSTAASASSDDWPMFHHDSSNAGASGDNPSPEGFHNWTATGRDQINYGGPIVVNGTVYLGVEGFRAFDARTGTPKWVIPHVSVQHSAAVAKGVVYFGGNDTLYAVDAATGKEKWHYVSDNEITVNPVVANNVVYFLSQGLPPRNGTLYALDTNTHALLWKTPQLGVTYFEALSYAENTVVVAAGYGPLQAFNANNGTLRWATFGDKGSHTPTIMDGVVYATSGPPVALRAYDLATGRVLWEYDHPANMTSAPAAADGRVFNLCKYLYLCAFDAKTGTVLWEAKMYNGAAFAPAVADGYVFAQDDLFHFDIIDESSGRILQTIKPGFLEVVDGTPAYANGILYLQESKPYPYVETPMKNASSNVWELKAIPIRSVPPGPAPSPPHLARFEWALVIPAFVGCALVLRRKGGTR